MVTSQHLEVGATNLTLTLFGIPYDTRSDKRLKRIEVVKS